MKKSIIYRLTLSLLFSIWILVNGYSAHNIGTSDCHDPIFRNDISSGLIDNYYPPSIAPSLMFGPFGCSSSWYQTFQTSPTWFIGVYDFNNLAALSVFGSYGNNSHKCIGYNTLDDYLYTIKGNGTVLRMHSDGSEDDLGDSMADNFFGNQMQVGGFDDSGNFYFKSIAGNPIAIMDVTTIPATYTIVVGLGASADFLADDWAFHSGTSTFYGVENGSLWSYDGGTGVSSTGLTLSTCETGVNLNGAFGSAYAASDGFIYVVQNNSGNIYQIDVLNNTAKYILNGPTPLNQPDGASCPSALPPFPTVFAEDDEFCLDGDGNATVSTQFDNDIVNQSTVDLASFSIVTGPSFGTTGYAAGTGELTYTSSGTPQNDVLTYKICATDQMSGQQICCCAEITFNSSPSATFDPFGPYCQNSTPDLLPSMSNEGVNGSWTPSIISTSTIGDTDYIFESSTGSICESMTTITVTVNPSVTTDFTIDTEYCVGDSEPILPLLDDNGIAGTWDATNISTSTAGMTDYMFTPDDPTLCASLYTLTVNVVEIATPTFIIGTIYCQDDSEPMLPLIDDNGITGTWDATSIATSSPGMTDYMFTPDDPTQCASNFTLTVTVTPAATPTFTIGTIYCQDDSEPMLPLVDDNGITGNWDATNISTSTPGMTDYMFTPDDPTQCASNFTFTVTVTPAATPTFTIGTIYCQGDSEPMLPLVDDNGITGNWDATNISTSSPGMTDYMFTPDDPTQCASNFILTVTVTPPSTPTFTIETSYCQDDSELMLPLVDDNGITGNWDATNISTSSPGMTDYMFTPDDPTQCASNFTLTVTVTETVIPDFSIETIYCEDDTEPMLPLVDDNGVTGVWDATNISTSSPGMTDYMFTPDDPTQCASDFTLTVTVTPTSTPTFSIETTYCQDDSEPILPFSDDNGITGIWDATNISTSSPGMTDYMFTPDDPAQCASNFTLTVTISPNINPTFTIADTYCIDDVPEDLPVVSNNGIVGSWSPTSINTSIAGTTEYVFTPSDPGCFNIFTIEITIEDCDCMDPAEVSIDPIDAICEDETIILTAILEGSASTVTWTTNGDGFFDDVNSLNPEYTPGASDILVGSVTLTATTNDPDGSGVCTAASTNVILIINTQETPIFNIQDEYCEGVSTDPLISISDNGISGTWDATQISNTTSTTYTFTPDEDECAINYILMVDIFPNIDPTFDIDDLYCNGDIADDLPTSSDNGINGAWSPSTINTTTANTNTYIFTPDPDNCANSFSILITVEDCGCADPPTVIIDPISPICENETINLLATIGGGASTVTWTTSGDGSFDDVLLLNPEYTPGASDISGGNVTLTVTTDDPDGIDVCMPATENIILTINSLNDPTFNIQDIYCEDSMTDPLPSMSDNGISGSWDAAQIDNTASANYTFTPDALQCANDYILMVNIDLKIDPTFNLDDVYCEGSTTDPLPSISDNGIMGTWDAVQIDNNTSSTYTFTPEATFCANNFELVVDIIVNVDPLFNLNNTYCIGDMAEILPSVSDNGINGTWSPIDINTASANTNTYIFTPDGSTCAIPFSISISVNDCGCADPALVSIDPIAPICVNETINLTSVLGGSASMISWTTSGDGTFDDLNSLTPIYTPGITDIGSGSVAVTAITDDPDGSGMCSPASATVNLVINAQEIPIFTIGDAYCDGSVTDPLPTISNNGITGLWNVNQIDNAASATYTFTPDISECAVDFILDVEITPNVDPIFNINNMYCIGDAADILPSVSDNGIDGTWTPGIINTTVEGTDTYFFTPDANICANSYSLPVLIEECGCADPPTVIIDPISPICETETMELASTIGGGASIITWTTSGDGSFNNLLSLNPVYNPGISDIASGTVTLIATTDDPDGGGLCIAAVASVDLIINVLRTPIFNIQDEYCEDSATDALPLISDNGIIGTWDVSQIDNSNSATYTFAPDASECAVDYIINVNISSKSDPLFSLIDTYCIDDIAEDLLSTSDNGIAGIWSPSSINTSISNSTLYTFIPEVDACANPFSINITVDDCGCADPAILIVDPINSICINETVNLVATLGGSASTITWTTSGDGIFNDVNSLTPIYTPGAADEEANIIMVTATTDDPDGSGPCIATTEQFTITINDVTFESIMTAAECKNENTGSIEIENVDGGQEPYQYSIDNGDTFLDSNYFDELAPGQYQLAVNDANGCSSFQNVTLDQIASPFLALGQDTTLQLGQVINLVVTHNLDSLEIDTIIWSPAEDLSCNDCLNPIASPVVTTTYQVMIIDTMGCIAKAEILVTVLSEDNEFAPNIFSPNGDGSNDMFLLYPNHKVEVIEEIIIYDRWGNIVYKSKSLEPGNFSSGWDGTSKGQDLTPGVYIYLARLRMKSGDSLLIKGDVTMIR